jgi:hypothetical protein
MRFFTIKIINAGLSDQLNQISYLYAVGKALSYTYVHTPFNCPWSSNSLGLVSRLIRRFSKVIAGYSVPDRVVKFIGLDRCDLNIDDADFSDYQIVDVNLEEVFSSNENLDIFQVQEYVDELNSSSKKIIYSFMWTMKMYKLVPKLAYFIYNLNESDGSTKFDFAKRYWKARASNPVDLPFDHGKVTVALHIRRGETACIKLNDKIIATLGKVRYVNSIEEANDKWTEQIDTKEYYAILEKMFTRYGEDKFSVVVLSDGYDRTFKTIKNRSNLDNLKLSKDELMQLSQLEKSYDNEEFQIFKKHSNISTIIGESEQKLFQSIHAIACADVVIYSSRSFAVTMQKFSEPNRNSVMIKYNENNLDSIEEKIQQKFSL